MRIERVALFVLCALPCAAAAGAMLWAAAALQGSGLGRTINLAAGLALIAIGCGFHVVHRRMARSLRSATDAD